jgi:hypothetical protein
MQLDSLLCFLFAVVESFEVRGVSGCAIARPRNLPWPGVISNVLACWGLAGPGSELGDTLIIPDLPVGVRWIQVCVSSNSDILPDLWGLALDSEGKVWNLPYAASGVAVSVVPQSLAMPMVKISMAETVGCGIVANSMEIICWLTPFHGPTISKQIYGLIHTLPLPPMELSMTAFSYSDVQCFEFMCAGVATNLWNSLQIWGSKGEDDGDPVSVIGDPTYLPVQAGVLAVEIGHDLGCILTVDQRMICFSTDSNLLFDGSIWQSELWIYDNYINDNPFAAEAAYTYGLNLIPQFQFAAVKSAKGLIEGVCEYLLFLSPLAWNGCVFPGDKGPPANTTALPNGGFYAGILGPNQAAPNFKQAATLKRIEAAAGYYCALDIGGRVICANYEQDGQGITVSAANADPRSIGPDQPYSELAAGQGFYCLLRLDSTLWCNNVTVSNYLGAPSSIDVKMSTWSLPQFSSDSQGQNLQFSSIAAGDVHLCGVLKINATVRCWGWYSNYTRSQVGIDHIYSYITPIGPLPPSFESERFENVYGGTRVTCGIQAETFGAICWGRCDDTKADPCTPPLAPGSVPYAFRSLSVGSSTVCGVTRDDARTLICWPQLPKAAADSQRHRSAWSGPTGDANSNSNNGQAMPIGSPNPNRRPVLSMLQPVPASVATLAPLNSYSVGAEIRICPAGVQSGSGGMRTPLCSGGCFPGSFVSFSPLDLTLQVGAATLQSSLCLQSGQYCPKGTFCRGASMLPIPCPAGRFGSAQELSTSECSGMCVEGSYCIPGTIDATQFPCPAGRYGSESGLTSPACSGECQAGYYCLPSSRTPNPFPCPNYQYYCPNSTGSPLPVPAGQQAVTSIPASIRNASGLGPGQGMTGYSPCPSGSYCSGGQAELCAAGRYAHFEGQGSCNFCESGQYQDAVGATGCLFCQPGRYSSSLGNAVCLACPAGMMQAVGGGRECFFCAPGSYSIGSQPLCTDCAPYSYVPTHGAIACAACHPPNVVSVNRSDCLAPQPCPAGTYTQFLSTDTALPGDCIPCSPGRWSGEGTIGSCAPCPPDEYTLTTGSVACKPCPEEGIECDTEFGVGLPKVKFGYWGWVNTLDDTVSASSCPSGYCTAGNFLLLPAMQNNASAWNATGLPPALQSYLATQSPCSPNHDNGADNVLCGRCAPGFELWRDSCVECEAVKPGLLIAFLALSFALVLLLHVLSQRSGADTKVLIFFVQAALLQLGSFDAFMAWLGILNFDALQASGATCIAPLTPYQHILVQLLVPVLLVSELGFIVAASFL